MKYIKRHAEATVNTLSKMFGAILVAGRSVKPPCFSALQKG